MKREIIYYNIPDEYWHRIHFVRPRFKSNMESVLLYMATECCRIPRCDCKEYSQKYLNAIRMFPGNLNMAEKTLQNWRTEIPALFGFYTEDKISGYTETSSMARFLRDNQDLTQFLRLFLLSFQFPGGHLKPKDLMDIIQLGIKFKPAKLLIEVLKAGNEILSEQKRVKRMSISSEEATYCIFNDVRVTRGEVSPRQIAQTILENRANKIHYYNPKDPKVMSIKGVARSKGDVTRYAGDILDYMELANLVTCQYRDYYTLKGEEHDAIDTFINDKTFFTGYDDLYNGKEELNLPNIAAKEPLWFDYVNKSMNPELFKTDLASLLAQPGDFDVVIDDRLQAVVNDKDKTMKDVGDLGENIVYGHELRRLKINGYEQFLNCVKIVDSPAYRPGYDIESLEADGTSDLRYIEVKTTISKQKLHMYGFHMSQHEWNVAGTIKDHYCVYRLMLSEQSKVLYILRNPVDLYKKNKIDAQLDDGMVISFDSEIFKPTQLLAWKR